MSAVKVAAHVHSTWSYDGEWSLDRIAQTFTGLGYGAVLMAEHDKNFDQARWQEYRLACAAVSTADIVLVPGIEYSDAENIVHAVVWGADVSFLGTGRPTLETLRAAGEQDTAVLLAHPWRAGAISRFRPEWAPLLSATEIWNRKSDGIAPRAAARFFAERHGLAPFASLDFHCARQLFPLAMGMDLSGAPSTASIVRSIRGGACHPEFLGLPALAFTRGPQGGSLRTLERVRRTLRTPARRLAWRAR